MLLIHDIPNNSLTEAIRQIIDLAMAIHEKRRFAFNHSASEAEIEY